MKVVGLTSKPRISQTIFGVPLKASQEQAVVFLEPKRSKLTMDTGDHEKMDVTEDGDLYVCEYTETNVNKSDNEGNTALHKAARHGDHETVAACIRAGADVNIVNNVLQSPLFRASKFGHAECVQLLIQAGAKVNMTDRDGCTLNNENSREKQGGMSEVTDSCRSQC